MVTVIQMQGRCVTVAAIKCHENDDAFTSFQFVIILHRKWILLLPFLSRYEAATNELINEELGIAYPIVGGIPNMIPQEARLIQKATDTAATPTQE